MEQEQPSRVRRSAAWVAGRDGFDPAMTAAARWLAGYPETSAEDEQKQAAIEERAKNEAMRQRSKTKRNGRRVVPPLPPLQQPLQLDRPNTTTQGTLMDGEHLVEWLDTIGIPPVHRQQGADGESSASVTDGGAISAGADGEPEGRVHTPALGGTPSMAGAAATVTAAVGLGLTNSFSGARAGRRGSITGSLSKSTASGIGSPPRLHPPSSVLGGAAGGDASESTQPREKATRYLDCEKSRGDISVAYAHTVDPDQAELARRKLAFTQGARGNTRVPFNEQWARKGAPDRGSLYTVVSPAVVDRLPDPEVLASPMLHVEVSPNLLHRSTELAEEPAQRLQRLLLHLLQRAKEHGPGSSQSAEPLTGLGHQEDKQVAAKRKEEIEKLLTLGYSAHEADANRLLPAPLRGAKSGASVLLSKKGAAQPAAGDGQEYILGEPAELDQSAAGRLAHVGRAIAHGTVSSSAERMAIEALVAEGKSKASKAAEEAERARRAKATSGAARDGEQESAPPATALDATMRKRFQAILDELHAPIDVSLDLALKYTTDTPALTKALPLWEACVSAYSAHATFVRIGAAEDELAASRERCLQAAAALEQGCGDVASVGGTPFAKAVQ